MLADPCLGSNFGVTVPVSGEPRVLSLPDDGAALQQALTTVTVPSVVLGRSGGSTASAAAYFNLVYQAGGTAKIIVVLRKPAAGATAGELYRPPLVVVDIHDQRNWTQIVTRGLAQTLAALGDEFTMAGSACAAPPESWISDPDLPGAPIDRHRAGRNLIVLDSVMERLLGQVPIYQSGFNLDVVWRERFASQSITPYRPSPGAAVIGANPLA